MLEMPYHRASVLLWRECREPTLALLFLQEGLLRPADVLHLQYGIDRFFPPL